MTDKLGIIGVGHFAEYLVEGFLNARPEMEIILSPRGKAQAKLLAKKHGCEIAKTNQDVVNKVDIIILSIRPHDVKPVVEALKFEERQLIITVASGVSHQNLKNDVLPAELIRALPVSSAAVNHSPTLLYPENKKICHLLELLGTVIVLKDEEEFAIAAVYSAFYGWNFKFMEEIMKWGQNKGLSAQMTRAILQDMFSGMADMSKKDEKVPMGDIVETLATPGGITELGLSVINQGDGFEIWHDALDVVYNRLSGKK